ncbi:MAG: glycosyltransferase family 39 protein [bacterium]|nr:glycosyltransferase family 39 protein [bacterium]
MLQTILAWLSFLGLIAAAVPAALWWANRLQAADVIQPPLVACLTLTISAGGLSQVMLIQGVIGIPLTFWGIVLPYLVLVAPGWGYAARHAGHVRLPQLHVDRSTVITAGLLMLIVVSILYTGLYIPLYRADTTGIYLPAALPMFQQGILDPLIGADSLYRTYPVLIPSLYALSFMASGWENEYLAKLLPTLLSLGCIPASALIAWQLNRHTAAAWTAALLTALTPLFGAWASAGYVDLPMAFLYALCVWFVLRAWEQRSAFDALCAGIVLGLAANAKNAALLAVPLFICLLFAAVILRRVPWQAAPISLAACAGIGAPFYLRNLAGAGFILPATAWTEQAERTVYNLFAFVTQFENFGVVGIMILLALAALPFVVRQHRNAMPFGIVLAFALIYFAAWWWFVSYDPRFLLLILPLLTGFSGSIGALAWERIGQPMRRVILPGLLIAACVLTVSRAYYSAEYKDEFLRAPLMSHPDKLIMVGRVTPPP